VPSTQPSSTLALFAWFISHQPAVLFSQNKPVISNQPPVLFSQNKPAPVISHQPNENAQSPLHVCTAPNVAAIWQSLAVTPTGLFGKWRIQVDGRGLKGILGNFEL
jgi:hypothetical protein